MNHNEGFIWIHWHSPRWLLFGMGVEKKRLRTTSLHLQIKHLYILKELQSISFLILQRLTGTDFFRYHHSIRRNLNQFSFQLKINKPLYHVSTSAWKSQSLVGWSSPAPHSLKPAVSAERWPLLGLRVLFSPCHHALFITLRPLSVTNTAVQQLACTTLRPRDLMSALSPAVYFQSWDTLYHFILRAVECLNLIGWRTF